MLCATAHTQVKNKQKSEKHICNSFNNKELILLIYEEHLEIIDPTEKWAKVMKNHFTEKKSSSSPSTFEKMLTFIHNKRNARQIPIETPFSPLWLAKSKTLSQPHCLAVLRETDTHRRCWWGVNQHNSYGRQSSHIFPNYKSICSSIQQSDFQTF